MWWKKTISTEEIGQALWQLCCKFTGEFCANFRPKLQAVGFLMDPVKDRAFNVEALQLHLWVISLAINDDRDVLDILHNIFAGWDMVQNQNQASNTVPKRFPFYYQAFLKDKELNAKGLLATELADSALQCLLGEPQPETGFLILSEIDISLLATLEAVRKFRAEFKIRKP